MGKYDLGLARKIIEGASELSAKQEARALEEVSAARARRLSPAAEKANNNVFEILKSKKNMEVMNDAAKKADAIKATNIELSEIPHSDAKARTPWELLQEQKQKDTLANRDNIEDKVAEYSKSQDEEKANRSVASDSEPTLAADDKTKVAAIAPTMGIAASGFTNPLSVLKSGAEKASQVQRSIVNKILDLTGESVNGNPHVPQYAKDTYNKAADAIVSTGTNPLTYADGAGAFDGISGAAGAAYDAYKSTKPQTSYVDRNPVQQFKVKP